MFVCTIILIAAILSFILSIVLSINVISKIKRFSNQYDVIQNLLYYLEKDSRFTNTTLSSLSSSIDEIDHKLQQLSESFDKSNNTPQPKRLPTPADEEAITKTITDQIATEVALASDLRSPYKSALNDIILRVVETYPDIDIEYLVRKTVSIIELYSKR
jgi:uncharacterized phage infection (PIP) family protein YhgE